MCQGIIFISRVNSVEFPKNDSKNMQRTIFHLMIDAFIFEMTQNRMISVLFQKKKHLYDGPYPTEFKLIIWFIWCEWLFSWVDLKCVKVDARSNRNSGRCTGNGTRWRIIGSYLWLWIFLFFSKWEWRIRLLSNWRNSKTRNLSWYATNQR